MRKWNWYRISGTIVLAIIYTVGVYIIINHLPWGKP